MKFARILAAAVIALAMPARAVLAADGDVRSFVSGSFKEIRASHAGAPTIVHFWGLTCGPCLIELPDWGKLLKERPALNLVVVHTDRPGGPANMLSAAIRRAGLTRAQNWAFGDGSYERLRFEIDPKWRGEIPMTLLIGADGTTQRIVGSADMAQIRGWLDAQTKPEKSSGALLKVQTPESAPATNGVQSNAIGTL